MTINKKQLLASDIIAYLKNNSNARINDLYSSLIKKHRNHLTRNKFFSILTEMKKRGFIQYGNNKIFLNKNIGELPYKEILIRFINKWPNDLIDGLI